MTDQTRDKLSQPFPQNALKTRNQSGKNLTYVEGHTVIHRLNDATGNCWDFAIKDINTSIVGEDNKGNDILLIRAHVAMTIPGLGTREHIGVQSVRANAGDDLVKGAVTDALKKAATLFGVGLELYGPDYEAGETSGMHRVQTMPARQEPRPASRDDHPPYEPQDEQRVPAGAMNGGRDELATAGQMGAIFAISKNDLGWDKQRMGDEQYAVLSIRDIGWKEQPKITRAQAKEYIEHLNAVKAGTA
jgi:hypothetical protein